jgi:hypothetical protein
MIGTTRNPELKLLVLGINYNSVHLVVNQHNMKNLSN